jgi:hypothetical protein
MALEKTKTKKIYLIALMDGLDVVHIDVKYRSNTYQITWIYYKVFPDGMLLPTSEHHRDLIDYMHRRREMLGKFPNLYCRIIGVFDKHASTEENLADATKSAIDLAKQWNPKCQMALTKISIKEYAYSRDKTKKLKEVKSPKNIDG